MQRVVVYFEQESNLFPLVFNLTKSFLPLEFGFQVLQQTCAVANVMSVLISVEAKPVGRQAEGLYLQLGEEYDICVDDIWVLIFPLPLESLVLTLALEINQPNSFCWTLQSAIAQRKK